MSFVACIEQLERGLEEEKEEEEESVLFLWQPIQFDNQFSQ